MDTLTAVQKEWARQHANYLRILKRGCVEHAHFATSLLAYIADGGEGPFPHSSVMEAAVVAEFAKVTSDTQ